MPPPGLEPGTNGLWVHCANQLRYRGIILWCEWAGSNRHALRRQILSLESIPISPHSHYCYHYISYNECSQIIWSTNLAVPAGNDPAPHAWQACMRPWTLWDLKQNRTPLWPRSIKSTPAQRLSYILGGDDWSWTSSAIRRKIYSLLGLPIFLHLQDELRLQDLVSHYWEKYQGDVTQKISISYLFPHKPLIERLLCPSHLFKVCVQWDSAYQSLRGYF